MISFEDVSRLFDYCAERGVLIHRTSVGTRAKGSIAGCPPRGKWRYWRIKISGRIYPAHRLIFLLHNGWCPKILDHINRDPSDNRIENLRPATSQQNQWNRGARGTARTKDGTWRAQIRRADGKQIYLGAFKTEREAHEAYLLAKPKYHDWGSSEGMNT